MGLADSGASHDQFQMAALQKELILKAVSWYLAYALSYRDIEELMAERGVNVDHSTLNRRIIYDAPQLEDEFRKKHKRNVGDSWRMDKTYIKVKGVWHCLYRAVDKSGSNTAALNTINLQLSVLALLGLTFINITIRQIKYLNNIIEQDHRGIKRIIKLMLGFKAFHSAQAILTGIELHRMLKKGQHVAAENMPVYEQFYVLAA